MTPLDVRKANFRRSLRGFDPEEVRIFLDMVAGEYEKLLQENGMLSEKARHLSERLEEYHNLEKTLQNSIVTAERIAAESQDRSRRESESLIEDARVRGERIMEDARERLRVLSREIQELRTQKDLFVQRFRSVLAAQAELLDSHQQEMDKIAALDAHASSLISAPAVAPAEESRAGDAPDAYSQAAAVLQRAAEAEAPEPDPEDALVGDANAADDVPMMVPAEEQTDALAREAVAISSGGREQKGEGAHGFFRESDDGDGFFDPGAEEDEEQ